MSESTPRETRKLSVVEQIFCAWPIALVFVGGALGGACGGAAWAINTKIMASSLAAPMRYGLAVLTGLGAIALYFGGVIVLAMLFPTVFGAR